MHMKDEIISRGRLGEYERNVIFMLSEASQDISLKKCKIRAPRLIIYSLWNYIEANAISHGMDT